MKTGLTLGKKLGLIAFIISELLVFFAVGVIVYNLHDINYQFFNTILIFQGTLLVAVWGSKASSNFAREKRFDDMSIMGGANEYNKKMER